MFRGSALRSLGSWFPLPSSVSCDSDEKEMSLVEQADAAIEAKKNRIRTPMQFENLRSLISQARVQTYDGFRIASQKQVNLNTIVSHLYWVGSQAVPQPIYQYRIILHDLKGENMFNVGTDADFNIDGELKTPIGGIASLKTNFTISEQQGKNWTADVDFKDDSSAIQLSIGINPTYSAGASMMQAITPSITLGGTGTYSVEKSDLTTSFGGIYEEDNNQVSALWSNNLQICYLRRVNPNRVHLMTELTFDPAAMTSQWTVTGEYILKQSKIHMSVDSNFGVKSMLETQVVPGLTLQLASDVNQPADQYRFGFGFVFN